MSYVVEKGETANDLRIWYRGEREMYISSGGVANRTNIDALGAMYIEGGVANSTTIDGVDYYNRGVMYISHGGVANSTTVNRYGSMHISSGGMANITTVNSWGHMYIDFGGVAKNTIISGGAYIDYGGVATSTTVKYDGGIAIGGGGIAKNTIVNSGGEMSISCGGTATDITARNGAILHIAVAPDTYVQGTYNGSAFKMQNARISGYTCVGSMEIYEGGVANNTIVNSNGNMYIGWEGAANNTTVNDSGSMEIYEGGVANNTIVNSDGYMYIVWEGGVANNTIVNSGGYMSIGRGVANGTTVNSGGNMSIGWGGVAKNTIVKSGASMYVDGGIIKGSLQIADGADVTVYGTLEFAVAEHTVADDYLINDLSRISSCSDYAITIGDNQNFGVYKLAQGAAGFTGDISFGSNTDDYGYITVNGEKIFKGDTVYQLQQADGNLTLSVWHKDFIVDSGDFVFISSKFNAKTTGKKQFGIELDYENNAFNSIDGAAQKYSNLSSKTVVAVDSKVDGSIYANLDTVSASVAQLTIKSKNGTYSYKANVAAKSTLNISQDTGSTEFTSFATVNVTSAAVKSIDGGNRVFTKDTKDSVNKKGVVSHTAKNTDSVSAAGKITLKDGASAEEIDGYSNVTLTDSVAGDITNFTSKDSKSETATYDEAKNTVTRNVTLSHSETTAGTLKATNSTLGNVTGFATVTLQNVSSAGNFRRVGANGNKYSSVKETLSVKTNKDGYVTGTYNKTETFTRAGKFTATGSTVGNIENFSNVTLDGSKAEAITNFVEAKAVTQYKAPWENAAEYVRPDDYALNFDLPDPEVTKSLNGSVTLKNGASADSIENFKSVTMTGSEVVGTIENVEKVTVNKGDSAIGSYIGTDGNDTLTIAKGAVLTANKIDLGKGDKDKLAINGTLILTGTEIKAENITGKGEIAVVDSLFEDVSVEFANLLNVGATADNFRGTAYENADDSAKKAVKWDGKTEYNGWLGDWSGAKAGSDEFDFIKFKAQAGDKLTVSGDVAWTLLDKKGNDIGKEITAAGEYTIKLNHEEGTSISYQIKLA